MSPVAPVTLIVGDDDFLAERAVAKLISALTGEPGPAAGAAGGVHQVAAAGLAPGELTGLTTPSLFGGRTVVVVRGAQDAAKPVAGELTRLAAGLPPEVTLVVTHAGGARGKALLTDLTRLRPQIIECQKLTRLADRMAFVRGEFRQAGRTIDDSGVRALLDALGTDLREIASACSQLAADTTGVVDEQVVTRYYRGRAEASGFTVADRAIEGNLAEALVLLRWALAVGVSPVLITSGLAQGVRLLGRVGGAPRGQPAAALAAEAGVPLWKIDKIRQQMREAIRVICASRSGG
jgi:DNA polymerase-3 subunit delta